MPDTGSPYYLRYPASTDNVTVHTDLLNLATDVTEGLDLKLNLAGGTLTGRLTLSGHPTSPLHAATKQYVDEHSGSGGGGGSSLLTSGVQSGSVAAFVKSPVRVTATTPATEEWLVTGSNDTIEVEIGQYIGDDYTTVVTQTFDIAHATYSSSASAALYGIDFEGTGFRFGSQGGYAYVEIDDSVYPMSESYVLKVTGGTGTAELGFEVDQEATPENGEWYALPNEELPAVVDLAARVDTLEDNASSSGGLSATRKRISGYWYWAGPPGAISTGTPASGTAMAVRIPGLRANDIISDLGAEVTTALTGGTTGVMDYYIAQNDSSIEYPGIIGGYIGQKTWSSSDALGLVTITATNTYTIPEDGDYWLIYVLRSGTSPTFRSHVQNTTVGFGSETPGMPGLSTAGRAGYTDASFPAHGSITLGTTTWTTSKGGGNIITRHAFKMG